MKVENACANFLKYCRSERGLSEHTLAAYEQDLNEFIRAFADRRIDLITGEQLVAFSQTLSSSRSLSPATIKRRLACLRAMFRQLLRQKTVRADPFAEVDLRIRIPARLPRHLAMSEVRALLKAARSNPTTRVAVLLLVATGIRIGELATIRLQDVDFDQRSIRIIGKGNRERRVFLSDSALVDALRDYISVVHGVPASPQCHLLMNQRGKAATAACLRNQIIALGDKAKLMRHVTPHMFRHTAATNLVEAGVDIRFVQRLLGHKSIATTQIYTYVSDGALRNAIVSANVYRVIEPLGG